jgi:ketosteroid isomerase-like protein/carbon monoxide dehydrogenase subunit G
MPTIRNAVTIDRSPDDVWALLRELSAVTDWVPGIDAARVEGTRRICTTAEGMEIHEEIELDDRRRRYEYTQTKHPLGFRKSRGSLAVSGNGAGARVSWDAEVEFADAAQEEQFLPLLEQGYASALETLKRSLERRPLDVVNRFYEVTSEGKTAELASLVAEDVTFDGPVLHARGAREYLAMSEGLLGFHRGTRMLRQFENGDAVCSIYELTMATPAGGEVTMTMADWIEVARGKIAAQRIYFDPREFAQSFGM